jgi:hypothetical protein
MAKDLIVGVVTDYDWDKIKYWANSIEKSGFDGHKALIVYNMDAATAQILTDKGFMLIGADKYDEKEGFTYSHPTDRIMVDRFFHIYNFLKLLAAPEEIDYVILTDVRDVVFQTNPSEWLRENNPFGGFELIVGSENLRYKDEPWGRNNLEKSFGQYFYDDHKEDEIFCAGVIAGSLDYIRDFALNLWLVCRGSRPRIEGGGGPDQAALNMMLRFDSYLTVSLFTNPHSGWVLHAGTSMPAIEAGSGGIGEAYRANPNMELPFIHNFEYSLQDGEVHVNGVKTTIVHQWDRVPEWKKLFEERFA